MELEAEVEHLQEVNKEYEKVINDEIGGVYKRLESFKKDIKITTKE